MEPPVGHAGLLVDQILEARPRRHGFANTMGKHMLVVLGHGVGEVFVDGAQWAGTPDGTRAGIASFFSKCLHDGEPIDVLDGPGGNLLAVYASTSGLENRSR